MPDIMSIVSYGFGTLFGFVLTGFIVFWLIHDLTQTKHSILRNYPLIGHLRYFLEKQGETGRILPPVFFCQRSRRDAVQPRHPHVGVQEREK